jgi:hypothetical protein
MGWLKKLFGIGGKSEPHDDLGASFIASVVQSQQMMDSMISDPEPQLRESLSQIEAAVKEARHPRLPIVRLSFTETPLGFRAIVWCYRTSYDGPQLDVDAAEDLLRHSLKTINMTVSKADHFSTKSGESSVIFEHHRL